MSKQQTSKLRLYILLVALLAIIYNFYMPPLAVLKLYREYFTPFSKHAAKILLVHNNGFGERETIARLKIAAKRLNIDLRVLNGNETNNPRQAQKIRQHIYAVMRVFRPDFMLALEDMLKPYHGIPNYATLTRGGNNRYIQFAANGRPALALKNLQNYDALLTAFSDTSLLKNAFEEYGKKYFGIPWYPTAYVTEYDPATPRKLFYSGGHLWDQTRGSAKYLELFKKLDKTGYFVVCGVKENWQHTPNSLLGQLPFDGESVISRIHDAGVALILHHTEHIIGGAPTSRIFEAAAANAVIITDKHPFIMEHFADNVLYIDIDQSADQMFKQIDNHMQWILQHPHEARAMAEKCNSIYKQKFSLEQQLLNLLTMHKEFQDHTKLLSKIQPSKNLVITKPKLPKYWALIQIKRHKYRAYLDTDKLVRNGLHWKNKLSTVLKTLDQIQASDSKIPNGNYFICLDDGVHVKPHMPVLAFASNRDLVAQQQVVLLPDNEALSGYSALFQEIDIAKSDFPWQKKIAKIFWRGQTTGGEPEIDPNTSFPRLQLLKAVKGKSFIDAAFTHFTAGMIESEKATIAAEFPLQNFVAPTGSLQYKYLLDIDGHSCSYSRMAWIMRSNSLLLKHTSNKVQWYYDQLQPYVHYLPIAADFSNLDQQFAWAQAHPQEAFQITQNSQELAAQVFDPENIIEATRQAFIKYHKLMRSL